MATAAAAASDDAAAGAPVRCSIAGCPSPAAGPAARSHRLSLCRRHLDADVRRARAFCETSLASLNAVESAESRLRLEQSATYQERNFCQLAFDDLLEGLDGWEATVLAAVSNFGDALDECQAKLRRLDELEAALTKAEEVGDTTAQSQVVDEASELLTALEAVAERVGGFEKLQTVGDFRRRRLLGDATGRLADATTLTYQLLLAAVGVCEENREQPLASRQPISEQPLASRQPISEQPLASRQPISELRLASPVSSVAVCRDFGGFCADVEGDIVVDDDSVNGRVGIPSPSLYIVYRWMPHKTLPYLTVAPVEGGELRLKCRADVDWQKVILRVRVVDSRRLLLLAQGRHGLTICSLDGRALRRFDDLSVGSVDVCDDSMVLLLDCGTRCGCVQFADWKLGPIFRLPVGGPDGCVIPASLTTLGNHQLLVISQVHSRVLKVCRTTGKRVRHWPKEFLSSDFKKPACTAVPDDLRSPIIFTDYDGKCVRFVLHDGSAQLAIGADRDGKEESDNVQFGNPIDLCIVELDGGVRKSRQLAVADCWNCRVLLFELNI